MGLSCCEYAYVIRADRLEQGRLFRGEGLCTETLRGSLRSRAMGNRCLLLLRLYCEKHVETRCLKRVVSDLSSAPTRGTSPRPVSLRSIFTEQSTMKESATEPETAAATSEFVTPGRPRIDRLLAWMCCDGGGDSSCGVVWRNSHAPLWFRIVYARCCRGGGECRFFVISGFCIHLRWAKKGPQ